MLSTSLGISTVGTKDQYETLKSETLGANCARIDNGR